MPVSESCPVNKKLPFKKIFKEQRTVSESTSLLQYYHLLKNEDTFFDDPKLNTDSNQGTYCENGLVQI